jgi:predicted lipoprotein with Yx(FWY)xxD motif
MDRSWIIARCGPALLAAAAVACASRGPKTNVSSPGDVARDTAAASVARRDTAASVTKRDTAAAAVTRRDTAAMPAMPTMPMAAGVQLAVAEAPGVGNYVTDAAGRAVYVIESAANAAVDCVETCTNDFEPVIGKATIAAGVSGLDASLLGTKALPDGRQQVTYEGKPLFFAKADMAKGDTKGQGTKSYGNARLLTPKK